MTITTLTQLQSLCANGGSDSLGADISGVSVTVASGKTVTLDLKTYTLTGGGSNPVINVRGTFILNGTTGNITGGGYSGAGVYVYDSCKFTMNGGNITDNRASGASGGGVWLNPGAAFTMNGGTISNNYATNYGGGVYIKGGTFEMKGGSITGNTAAVSGGGVIVYNSGVVTMTGGNITGNAPGGITISSGSLTMSDGTITGNSGSSCGGVSVGKGTFTMTGGTISGNSSNVGGGVKVTAGTFNMSGGTIGGTGTNEGNKATSDGGGGVYVTDSISGSGTFTMTGGTIVGNAATRTGSGYGGGGVRIDNTGTFTMSDNASVTSNTSSSYGGGVFVKNGSFTMNGGVVSDNHSEKSGGGVNLSGTSTLTMNGGSINNNSTNQDAGGLNIDGSGTLNLYGGSITGNSCINNEGGAWRSSSSAIINIKGNPVVKNNTSNGAENNIYFGGVNSVSIVGDISSSAKIKVIYPITSGSKIASNAGGYTGVERILSDDGQLMGGMSGTDVVWVPYVGPVAITLPVNVNGVWKDAVAKVYANGSWHDVIGIWANVSGEWKVVAPIAPPEPDHGVYTISWTESSTSKNISWSGDAAGMTEADRLAKIKEHCHFAVVQWDGTKPAVNYWLYDEDLNYKATDETGKTSSGQSSVLTGADGDVMMLYETVWWKVTTSGSGTSRRITISFTWDESNTDSTWVSPHHYGDSLSATTYATYVGMGVFPAYNSSNQMRSINTSSEPTGNVTQNNFYVAATSGRNWQYNNKLPMTYAWYIIQLYFVKGNRDCQAAYGNGIVSGGAGATNKNWSATNAWNNGTTANKTTGVTALGVHNPWGQKYEFLGECRNDGGTIKFSALCGKDHYNIESGTASTWVSATGTSTSYNCITEICGSSCQEYPFFGTAVSGTDYSIYYADYWYGSSSSGLCVYVGGIYAVGLKGGPLFVYANYDTSYSYSGGGARLHVTII